MRRVAGTLAGLIVLGAELHAEGVVTTADFATSQAAGIAVMKDAAVAAPEVSMVSDTPDSSPGLRFAVTLDGPNAGWAGVRLPVAEGALHSGMDTIHLKTRRVGVSRDLFVTLTDRDGGRWNANVRLDPEWRDEAVPLHHFNWFEGPDALKDSHPDPARLRSVDLWVRNRFPGAGGFDADSIGFSDAVASHTLVVETEELLPVDSPVTVRLKATDGAGNMVKANSTVWIEPQDRNAIKTPRQAAMRDGVVEFEAFPRQIGRLDLKVHEPYTRQTVSVPLVASSEGLVVDFSFEGEGTGEQAVFASAMLRPVMKLSGGSTVPLSAHFELRDHRGRRILARNMNAGDLAAGNERIRIPCAGLFEASVKLVAEPTTALPRGSDPLPMFLGLDPQDRVTSAAAVMVPDGVTTDIVVGHLVQLEDLPATATVVGEERFTVWALAVSPREQVLYGSPFGLCSGALFHLPKSDRLELGAKRLRWHRLLGSRWARNDVWWHETETTQTAYSLSALNDIVEMYRTATIKLAGILCYEAAWSPGVSPADDEQRGHWSSWVTELVRNQGVRIPVYEVWNEPNVGYWKPKPDVEAYRELVKATHQAVKPINDEIKVVAGATAGYDPVFTAKMLDDGFHAFVDTVSFHPYPVRFNGTPENNDLTEVCEGMRNLMRRHDMVNAGKELWITEIGWPTGPGGVTEEEQANYLMRAYALALGRGLTKVYWFNLMDWSRHPWEGGWDHHLGLLDSNYRPKPSAVSYNLLQFMLCRTSPAGESTQGKAHIQTFDIHRHSTKWASKMHLAWMPDPKDSGTIELDLTGTGGVLVVDYLGAEIGPELVRSVSDDNTTTKTYRIPVTGEPVYIWDVAGPPPRK